MLFLAWIALLVVVPLLWFENREPFVAAGAQHVDIGAHGILEAFCATTAFLIGTLLFAIQMQYRKGWLAVFAAAFFGMAAFDLLHASVDPNENLELFVALHTASSLLGGFLLSVGVVWYFHTNPQVLASAKSRNILLGVVGILFFAVGYELLPTRLFEEATYAFSSLSMRAHELAGLFYAICGTGVYLYYRSTRRPLALLAAALLLLFGESAFLFRFSYIWDRTWWIWHFVKVLFYVGTLLAIAGGFIYTLRRIQRANIELADLNIQLKDAHAAIAAVNGELRVRNGMASEALTCRGLGQTIEVVLRAIGKLIPVRQYTLMLWVPADEAGEIQREIDREGFGCRIIASGDRASHQCQTEGNYPIAAHCKESSGVCLVLKVNDREFGRLALEATEPDAITSHRESLGEIAKISGPIIYNALLQRHTAEEVEFRTALLGVSTLLGGTLDIKSVLGTVCRQSARILGSDVSSLVVGSYEEGHVSFSTACGEDLFPDEDVHRAWRESETARAIWRQVAEGGAPLSVVRRPEVGEEAKLSLFGQEWGAVALFPLMDNGRVMGTMALMRRSPIPFSTSTIDKGKLLAERVGAAVDNYRLYETLREVNRQLREAEEGKLRAERLAVMGQMAAAVAHEVRNPLGAIANCLAVLKGTVQDDGNRGLAALKIMEGEVARLERLTRNFLSFGKPAVGISRHVDLSVILESVRAGVLRHSENEGIDVAIRREVRGTTTKIWFDGDALHEVLWNLMLNAVQSFESRSGLVSCDIRVRERTMFIAVVDNGRGLSPHVREKVFEPFFTQRSRGMGLGLAIVQQYVRAWNGRIRVVSGVGKGSCFALRMPLSPQSGVKEQW